MIMYIYWSILTRKNHSMALYSDTNNMSVNSNNEFEQ